MDGVGKAGLREEEWVMCAVHSLATAKENTPGSIQHTVQIFEKEECMYD